MAGLHCLSAKPGSTALTTYSHLHVRSPDILAMKSFKNDSQNTPIIMHKAEILTVAEMGILRTIRTRSINIFLYSDAECQRKKLSENMTF